MGNEKENGLVTRSPSKPNSNFCGTSKAAAFSSSNFELKGGELKVELGLDEIRFEFELESGCGSGGVLGAELQVNFLNPWKMGDWRVGEVGRELECEERSFSCALNLSCGTACL